MRLAVLAIRFGTDPRRRPSAILLVICLVPLIGVATAASPASAGIYEVRTCLSSGAVHFDGRYEQYGQGRIDLVQNCDRAARGKVGIYQTRKGTPFSEGEGAGYHWYAPTGASFIGSRVYGKLRNANGIAAQIFAINANGGYLSLDAGHPHDGVERQMVVDFGHAPRSYLNMRLACLTKPPCSNRANDVKAFYEMREINLRLRDGGAPTVQVGGELFTGGTIYRGKVGFSFSASDNGGGLVRARAEINGSVVDLGGFSCPGARLGFADRTLPCPSSASRQGTFDTAHSPFSEGSNRVRICVDDYATVGSSNTGCSGWRNITVDNVAPGPLRSLTVVGGEGWRAENGFDLEWSNPPAGSTPLTGARYWIEDAESGSLMVGPNEVSGAAINRLRNLRVPRIGHFRVYIQLRDGAGNLSTPSAASLRFDDQPPGNIGSQMIPEWLGAADFPFRLKLQPPVGVGPSGLAGYAVSLSTGEPVPPCLAEVCRGQPGFQLVDAASRIVEIQRLMPGTTWLSAVAVSGANVGSTDPHQLRLQVDLTDPETKIAGVPDGWTRGPVTLTAEAFDHESGMVPRTVLGLDLPQTAIEIPGQPIRAEVGDRAEVTIKREGIHQIRFWARDLAGNAGNGRRDANGHRHRPAGETTVKIDRTAPQAEFVRADPEYPELLRVRLTDNLSGPVAGGILIRREGSSRPAERLEATLKGSILEAHFPSDQLATGRYEITAYGVDRAGNSGAGAKASLRVPLKPTPTIVLGFASRGRSNRQVVGHGAELKIRGRLRDHEGKPVANGLIEVVERFRTGARRSQRISPLRTDPGGGFWHRLAPGPSRQVRIRFPGSRKLARTESAPLQVAAKAAISINVAPLIARNGDAIRIGGRVRGRGANIPAKGKLVAIQYLDANRRRWRPVDLIQTDRRGRFRYSYRFRTVVIPQKFVFRAVAIAEAGWPYLAARTRGRAVVIYPR